MTAIVLIGSDRISVNKGPAIETMHYLNDGLWRCGKLN